MPKMDPKVLTEIQAVEAKGEYERCMELLIPSFYVEHDDQQTYFDGLVAFIRDVDRPQF